MTIDLLNVGKQETQHTNTYYYAKNEIVKIITITNIALFVLFASSFFNPFYLALGLTKIEFYNFFLLTTTAINLHLNSIFKEIL